MRALEACGETLLIVYNLPEQALARGYVDFLRAEDNPFFNAIPGIRHYANWRIDATLSGPAPGWRYFDFFGLDPEATLDAVWFDSELDRFRANWIERWGYGAPAGEVPEELLYAYAMRAEPGGRPWPRDAATMSFGAGESGQGASPPRFRLTHAVKKHFSKYNAGNPRPMRTPLSAFNPLGFDWIDLGARADAAFVVTASRIAGPD